MSGDSYAQSGRKKRQKVLASGSQVPKHRGSKDTKRWCKGVPGREHVWIWEEWKHSRSFNYDPCVSIAVCKACRRNGNTVQWRGRERLTWEDRHRMHGPAF